MTKEQAIQLIHGYLDDTLTEEDELRLRDWLQAAPENADLFAEIALVHTSIQRLLEVNDLGDSIHTLLKNKKVETGQTIDLGTAIEDPPPTYSLQDAAELPELPEYHRKPAKRRGRRQPDAGIADDDHQPVVNMFGVRVYQKTVERAPRENNTRRYLAAAVVLVAALLGVYFWHQAQPTNGDHVTLTAENGLVWGEPGFTANPGDRLQVGSYETRQGVAEFVFDRGAKVILDGPCRFELVNDNEMTLLEGRIVASIITPEAVNFTVNTPQAKVVDLGTEFGVEVSSRGKTLAAVFDGKVDLTGQDKDRSDKNNVVLSAGWQGVVNQKGSVEPAVTHIPYDHAFTRSLADSYNRLDLELSGQVKWNRRAPHTVRPEKFHTDGFATVFNESRRVEITEAVREVIREPGQYKAYELQNRMKKVHPGRVVDSYLVHYDPDLADETQKQVIRFAIKFPRPIRGVLANNQSLFDTDNLFRKPNTRYPLAAYRTGIRGIDKGDGADFLEIHPDGQTISFEFSGTHYDQVRVLIDSEAPIEGLTE